jgi:hypothetical protein
MASYSNKEIIDLLQNGNEEVLFYLSKKLFPPSRKLIRRIGFSDTQTPFIFSKVLIETCREIQQKNVSKNVDFVSYFYNSLSEFSQRLKKERSGMSESDNSENREIVSSCFSILDDSHRIILAARLVEKLTFEQIASRFNLSNPVIAQFEFNRAFSQLEKITRARLFVEA